jgi:hypothetical protein
MTVSKNAKPGPPKTLMQAHEALVRVRPKDDASLAAWLAYYQHSAALYAELAEIDWGHHCECMYWTEREEDKAKKLQPRSAQNAPSHASR